MDGPIGARRPPRLCPICGLPGGWDYAGGRGYGRAGLHGSEDVRMYNDHLRRKHLANRTWKRRLSAFYLVPILLLFVPVIVSAYTGPAASPDLRVALVSWLAALVVWRLIVRVRSRGTGRFRELWNQEQRNLDAKNGSMS